jgi:DNA-binding GntR family transcriptional regulator
MEPLRAVERQTAREIVVSALRDEILSGRLAPGERLVVPEVAGRFGVSQTPAREAIQSLESEGLVSVSRYKGARVAELDADECEEIYLMREALEKLAARLGAVQIDAAGVAAVRQHLAEMSAAVKEQDIERYLRADRELHEVQYLAAGRPGLWERIKGLRYSGERYTRLSYRELPHELPSSIARHEELVECLVHHDAEGAEAWVSSTLNRVPRRIREILAHLEAEGDHPAATG